MNTAIEISGFIFDGVGGLTGIRTRFCGRVHNVMDTLSLAFPFINNNLREIRTVNIYPANTATNRRDGLVPNPKARLRQQVREVMRFVWLRVES